MGELGVAAGARMLRKYFGIADADDAVARRERSGDTRCARSALQDALPYLFGPLGIVGGADPIGRWTRRARSSAHWTRSSASSCASPLKNR